MRKTVHAVVKRPWRFLVTFKDGRQEEVTVEAESYHVAVYSLPSGKKSYKLLKEEQDDD